jgi:hypothetical protein
MAKSKGKAGRPSKLTPARQQKFCHLLAQGISRQAAAAMVGLTPETIRAWMARGKDPEHHNHEVYAAFFRAVLKAEAEAEAAMVAHITAAAPETWQAAAWWLERKKPAEWGRVTRTHLSADTGPTGPLDLVVRIGGKSAGDDGGS